MGRIVGLILPEIETEEIEEEIEKLEPVTKPKPVKK